MRMRAGLALLTLIGALTALAPDRAATAPGRSFFGVVPQTDLKPSDFRKMDRAGVGTLRLWLAWSVTDLQPPVGGYDFSAFDPLVADAARQRIRVLPFVWGSPAWVIRKLDGERCGSRCYAWAPSGKRALAAWRDFLAAAVERYGPGGTFWEEHPGLPKEPIRDWQLWNEQNSRVFFLPRTKPRRYAKLLRAGSRGIHSRDRRADVILGGMAELAGSRKAVPGPRYLAGLYRIRGIQRSFEAAAVHPYAAKAHRAVAQVRRFRGVMDAAGDRRGGLWVTEGGWSSAGSGNPLAVGPSGQAQRLRQALGAYRDQRRRLGLRGVLWYSWRDSPSAACAWCARSGLLTENGRPKPAFRAFRDLAR